jgi:hypothetical protein
MPGTNGAGLLARGGAAHLPRPQRGPVVCRTVHTGRMHPAGPLTVAGPRRSCTGLPEGPVRGMSVRQNLDRTGGAGKSRRAGGAPGGRGPCAGARRRRRWARAREPASRYRWRRKGLYRADPVGEPPAPRSIGSLRRRCRPGVVGYPSPAVAVSGAAGGARVRPPSSQRSRKMRRQAPSRLRPMASNHMSLTPYTWRRSSGWSSRLQSR